MPSASRLTRQSRRIGASSSMTSTRVAVGSATLYPLVRVGHVHALGRRQLDAKLAPSPSRELTHIRPPMAATSPRAMKSPRPAPPIPSREGAESAR